MDAPDTEYSVPDGHAEQEEAPFAEYMPPSQSEQRLSPLPEYFPPGHGRHAVPFAENVPGEQKAHVAPSPLGAAPAPQVALLVTRSGDRSRLSLHGTTQPLTFDRTVEERHISRRSPRPAAQRGNS